MTDATHLDSQQDLRDNARGITAMPAFQEWRRQVEEQINLRRLELLKPIKPDETLEQEYKKGECAGLMHAVMQWQLMIEHFEREVALAIEKENSDEDAV